MMNQESPTRMTSSPADSVLFDILLKEEGYWIPTAGTAIELALVIHTGVWKHTPLAAVKFPVTGVYGTQYLIYDFLLAQKKLVDFPWRTGV